MEDNKKLILPFDDVDPSDEDVLDEMEKEKQEIESCSREDMEKKLELADEINGDEHTKAIPVEPKMPKNEKLILAEPTDDINEGLNESPNASDFGRDVYDALSGVMRKYQDDGVTLGDLNDAIRWFKSRFSFRSEFDESKTSRRKK